MGGGDHSEFGAFVLRILRAYGRRVASADVEDLSELLAVRDAVDAAITRAVAGLRDTGRSWGEIAAATGTTRQAAQQRYGVKVALTLDTRAAAEPGDTPEHLASAALSALQGPISVTATLSA